MADADDCMTHGADMTHGAEAADTDDCMTHGAGVTHADDPWWVMMEVWWGAGLVVVSVNHNCGHNQLNRHKPSCHQMSTQSSTCYSTCQPVRALLVA